MKKLVLITLLLLSLIPVGVLSQTVADPSDVFYVTHPTPNQKVKATLPVSWRMFDDEQTAIQYTAVLYDFASCNDGSLGSITPNNQGLSSATQDNVINWDTRATQSRNPLNDGRYCLRICAAMTDGETPYSVCNSRIITVINNNRLPIINSTPSNTTLKESDSWQYQINATDPDGDALTYRLVETPAFLSINTTTGLVQTNSVSKKLPSGITLAQYRITVGVNDNMAGETYQTFNLSIIPDTPPPSPTQNGGEKTPPPITNSPAEIEILFPTQGSTLKGDANEIKWRANDADGIKEIKLSHSKDQMSWTTIVTLAPDARSYIWDVKDFEDGEYYLRIGVTDNKGIEALRFSDVFDIKNKEDEEEEEVESVPLIINVVPENNSEITNNLKPTISGEFIASQGSEIDTTTFEIKLDDKDINGKCTVDKDGFSCALDENLAEGLHNIKASIKDTSKQVANREWQFIIKVLSPAQEAGGDTITILGRDIPRRSLILVGIICLISLILLLIPWILYILWRRRGREEVIETTYVTGPPSPSDLTTNYYYPPSTPGEYETPAYVVPETTVDTNYYYPPVDTTVQPAQVQPSPDYTADYTTMPTDTTYQPQVQEVIPEQPSNFTTNVDAGFDQADAAQPAGSATEPEVTPTQTSTPPAGSSAYDDYTSYLNEYVDPDQVPGAPIAGSTDQAQPTADQEYVEPETTDT